jgi:hypothetical protein
MGIKDLFSHDADTKVVSLTNKADAAENIESPDYYSARVVQKNEFEPHIDYSSASNFAKFGSAEKYYTDTITNIYTYYPFDGSFFERTAWEVSASGIQKYVYEELYPRTNGFIDFSYPTWGSADATLITPSHTPSTLYQYPDDVEYITIYGGPNKDPDGTDKTLASIFAASSSNFYDVSENRESNLEMSTAGNTVEWWMKKDSWQNSSPLNPQEVVFDLWASGSAIAASLPNDYGRLCITLNSCSLGSDPYSPIFLTYVSGTTNAGAFTGIRAGFSGTNAPTTASIADGEWHHYAVSIDNASGRADLYVDGVYRDYVIGDSINEVTGALIANVGSYYDSIADVGSPTLSIDSPGWCKLSASLDEFRFWKTARTDKQIGMNWFTQVGGGTNEDDANTDLGVYYKFNEGITLTASVDAKVLDYSGRFSDGSWTGYTAGARSTGSAMVIAGAAKSEFKDPIIYSFHPDVVSLLNEKQALGQEYDYQNVASIYNSVPSWIIEEDNGNLSNLTQIISSFFDSMQLKIQELPNLKNIQYLSSSSKPYPFTSNALESLGFATPSLFIQADVLEAIASRDDDKEFEEQIYNVKNLIYQNIYNNLVYIYNTKGTMKSFRNLLRCYGIDEELVRVNLYVDGQTFKIQDDYKLQSLEKKFVNFAGTDRFNGTVYMTASDATESDYFPGLTLAAGAVPGPGAVPYPSRTYESQIVAPSKFPRDSTLWFDTTFISASLFGQHSVDTDRYTWDSTDRSEFQVYLVKEELESNNAKFVLTTVASAISFPTLESPVYKDVYDNTNWNIAVKIKPAFALHDTGSAFIDGTGIIEFQGVQTEGDFIRNEFLLTGTLSAVDYNEFSTANSKFYAGAHYTNFTGSIREKTDVKITNNRVWLSHLPSEVIRVHAKDSTNYGTKNPYNDAYASLETISSSIPEIETLALSWGYDTLSSSDGGSGPGYTAGFTVADLHTSSADRDYDLLAPVLTLSHPGRGNFFLANDDDVIQKEYLSNAKLQAPETVQSDDLVEIISSADDEIFTRESRPLDYVYAIEKGMQQVISDEMINVFGSIVDFNNLIGAPVNRYRKSYDEMDKLRGIFFSRVKNTPSLIKYVEFYKWIDGAITSMVQQLVPATANFSDKVATVIESHVLERNKYWNKFPTVEVELGPISGHVFGGAERRYPWSVGRAPLPASPLPQDQNCYWWKNRADGTDDYIPTAVFENRGGIVSASHSTFQRDLNGIVSFSSDGLYISDDDAVDPAGIKEVIKFGSGGFISISSTDTAIVEILDRECDDE